MISSRVGAIGILVSILLFFAGNIKPAAITVDDKPAVDNGKKPKRPRPRPQDELKEAPIESIAIAGPIGPDGKTQVVCDLPVEQRTKNVGGRDGAGLCVFSSIGHAARWQNEKRLLNFQKDMRQEPGGGYPQKVDAMIAKYGKGTEYIQYEGNDPEIMKRALATGRMVSCTYNGHDPHYGNSTIAHMVNCVYLDDHYGVVLDNNFIGENELVWLSTDDFLKRWRGDGGWVVILLAPPPPPPPHN